MYCSVNRISVFNIRGVLLGLWYRPVLILFTIRQPSMLWSNKRFYDMVPTVRVASLTYQK